MVDFLRTQGSFSLSARYTLFLTLPCDKIKYNPAVSYHMIEEYEENAKTFEKTLNDLLDINKIDGKNSLEDISSNGDKHTQLSSMVIESLNKM